MKQLQNLRSDLTSFLSRMNKFFLFPSVKLMFVDNRNSYPTNAKQHLCNFKSHRKKYIQAMQCFK